MPHTPSVYVSVSECVDARTLLVYMCLSVSVLMPHTPSVYVSVSECADAAHS